MRLPAVAVWPVPFPVASSAKGSTLVQAFINYPLDVAPRNPGEVLPQVWEARTKGFYAFRNNWSGPESIVAQVYAKQGAAGWNQAEAGSFLIYGLGRQWGPKG